MLKMERIAELVLGWDCRNGCKDERHIAAGWKGGHGQHNDEWIYVVRHTVEGFGQMAVALIVNSHEATTRGDKGNEPPAAQAISIHVPFRVTEEHVKEQYSGQKCRWIASSRCFGDVRYDRAKALFSEFGQPKFEQTEAFWLVLEEIALEWMTEIRLGAAAFRVERCTSCAGEGIRPKVPPVEFTGVRRAMAIVEPLTGSNVPLPDKKTPEELAQHVETMVCSFWGWPGNKCSDAEMIFKVALGALRRQKELVFETLSFHACLTGDCDHTAATNCLGALINYLKGAK